jgi:hypothetical protein
LRKGKREEKEEKEEEEEGLNYFLTNRKAFLEQESKEKGFS